MEQTYMKIVTINDKQQEKDAKVVSRTVWTKWNINKKNKGLSFSLLVTQWVWNKDGDDNLDDVTETLDDVVGGDDVLEVDQDTLGWQLQQS